MGKQGNADVCPLCGAEMQNEEEHPDWITWYYYKDPKYGDYSLWDKPPLHPEELELIKEFKAPPESQCGLDEGKHACLCNLYIHPYRLPLSQPQNRLSALVALQASFPSNPHIYQPLPAKSSVP